VGKMEGGGHVKFILSYGGGGTCFFGVLRGGGGVEKTLKIL
jgi:hypothetical protein